MKRKIRGAVYDTDTAKKIASWPSAVTDEVEDGLYRTKSGKYFTYEFDERDDEHHHGLWHEITPISRQQAIEIAYYWLGVETARPLFEPHGGVEKTMSVRVSSRTYNIVRDIAAERGISMGQYIDELVNEGGSTSDDAALFDRLAEEERERKAGEELVRELSATQAR